MQYSRVYEELMSRAMTRSLSEYRELHHIVPRCLGGDDSRANLVELTAREHLLAHMLLVKMFPGVHKLAFALRMMRVSTEKQNRHSGRQFEFERKAHAAALSHLHKTRVRTPEEKANQRAAAQKALTGRVVSAETKRRISESQKARPPRATGYKRPGVGGRKKGCTGNFHKPRPETLKIIHDKVRKTFAPSMNTQGWEILTPSGFQPFHGVDYRGAVPTLEVKFTGDSIIVTPNHIFCTPAGEVRADALVPGDVLAEDRVVLSISKTGRKHAVFDVLEVSGHQYITNGVVSHNCQFVTETDKIVIPEFKESMIRKAMPDPLLKYYLKYVGMDLGFMDNTALLFGYYDFRRAKFVLQRELILKGTAVTSKAIAEGTRRIETELWGETAEVQRVSDNNNPILLNDIQMMHGVTFNSTSKDRLIPMVNQTRLFIGDDSLEIDPSCEYTIACLKFGIWNKNRDAFAKSKKYGHYDALAALIYELRILDRDTNPVPRNLGIRVQDALTPEPFLDTSESQSVQNLRSMNLNRRSRQYAT